MKLVFHNTTGPEGPRASMLCNMDCAEAAVPTPNGCGWSEGTAACPCPVHRIALCHTIDVESH